ncbi:Crp/Fnr family transcriptional regulator [Myroides sp. mNGS23_01]|nr:Crp/Fnr family transcriptional regulator [Myroides sp. mNGS23_01]WHT39038.1 Crp/Fnr family transcriptional regulator [Myroides sp. mNGS23_01]
MYINILNNVGRSVKFTEKEEEIFISLLKKETIPVKTKLLREGEICNFEGYVQKGCIRIYYVNEDGFEVTISFAIEDWWVSDIASFHEQTPSDLYIETLEDTELYVLTPITKEQLVQAVPKFERVFRILVQRNLTSVQNRLINTISKKASDRYLEFISLYPTIPQRVAQYYIASYLGVTAEFVSTIRKRLLEE